MIRPGFFMQNLSMTEKKGVIGKWVGHIIDKGCQLQGVSTTRGCIHTKIHLLMARLIDMMVSDASP
jgi:hypothetical protein